MNIRKHLCKCCLTAALLHATLANVKADLTVGVDPGAPWQGFMNVFDLGNNYVFGSPWGTVDLRATFAGPVLTLSPNTIGDPDPFWYIGGGAPGNPGNKLMDANMYVQSDGPLAGQAVTFTGNVLGNTLTASHTSVAFIKDFAPDFSSFNTITTPLVNGVFSISLATINDPLRHVQYGFETKGVNVWFTDVAPYGSVEITAVPEPTTAVLLLGGIVGFAILKRNSARFQLKPAVKQF